MEKKEDNKILPSTRTALLTVILERLRKTTKNERKTTK